MSRVCSVLSTGVLAASLFVSVVAKADDAASAPETESAKPAAAAAPKKDADAKPAAKAKRELAPALAPLRDLVRQTLAAQRKQAFDSQQNTATEIMGYSLGFGCGTEVSLNGDNGQRINGITCLCWNYPCAGFEMLGVCQNHIVPKIGYGYQERPANSWPCWLSHAFSRITLSASQRSPEPWPI
jgi:hypothetical protein